VFDSDGGDLIAGLSLGEHIRFRKFSTIVEANKQCASACALAWLGGSQRYMNPKAKIGFHAAYIGDGARLVERGVPNAIIGAYLTKLGLSYKAVVYVTRAAPSSMTWLTTSDAERLGIVVHSFVPLSRQDCLNQYREQDREHRVGPNAQNSRLRSEQNEPQIKKKYTQPNMRELDRNRKPLDQASDDELDALIGWRCSRARPH
jgi:hypothetical protein